MRREFHFKSSSLDESQFEVTGDPGVKTISTFNASAQMLEYFRSVYNHNGDPASFARIVMARQGGVVVNHGYTRWTPELYSDFMRQRQQKHEKSFAEYAAKALARYKEIVEPWEPLPELKPMYFDREAQAYKVEGFYGIQVVEAAGQMPAWAVSSEMLALSEFVN